MFLPRFSVISRTGIPLAEKWKDTRETYIAITTDDFPNYFICLGSSASLGAGNLLILLKRQVDYITSCIAKMQQDSVQSMEPRREVFKLFSRHCENLTKTVFGEKCRSWYKADRDSGRVVALWLGILGPLPSSISSSWRSPFSSSSSGGGGDSGGRIHAWSSRLNHAPLCEEFQHTIL